MVGACLFHFALALAPYDSGAAGKLLLVGMFASPTFVLVSGTLLGYLLATQGAEGIPRRVRLIDRGLFLLTVAHILIAYAYYLRDHDLVGSATRVYMTDAIGVSLIIGTAIVPRTSVRSRLA